MTPQPEHLPPFGSGIAKMVEHALYHPLEMGILLMYFFMVKRTLISCWEIVSQFVGSLLK